MQPAPVSEQRQTIGRELQLLSKEALPVPGGAFLNKPKLDQLPADSPLLCGHAVGQLFNELSDGCPTRQTGVICDHIQAPSSSRMNSSVMKICLSVSQSDRHAFGQLFWKLSGWQRMRAHSRRCPTPREQLLHISQSDSASGMVRRIPICQAGIVAD